ncbi:MAG: nucleotidyltransferase family protein [Deinococcota bacterium]|nr:nucleotidyltransferase family protein [Deinococcota bacterium]
MQRNEVLDILARHRPKLSAMGVASLALFGSVARNEAEGDSDVDLLVSFDRPVGFFHFLEVKDYLETVLKTRVDLVTEDALKKQLRERILAEAVRAA